jgi:hypothetical protein
MVLGNAQTIARDLADSSHLGLLRDFNVIQ